MGKILEQLLLSEGSGVMSEASSETQNLSSTSMFRVLRRGNQGHVAFSVGIVPAVPIKCRVSTISLVSLHLLCKEDILMSG